jgi:type I restriction enzyme S subunit
MMKTVTLGDIAREDRRSVSPGSKEALSLPFLGLEQIESQTGRILSYESASTEGVSNSFAFNCSHVLYGKLRPYLNKVAVPDRPGRCSTELIPLLPLGVSRDLLALLLRTQRVVSAAMQEKTGSRMPRAKMSVVLNTEFAIPVDGKEQERVTSELRAVLEEIGDASEAIANQAQEVLGLTNSIIFDSLRVGRNKHWPLGEVLDEVKSGIGKAWKDFRVLGATRDGLALAKEPPGKNPHRYKPVTPGTVFYNPMRILIGSVAFVDDDDEPGITSPDYVAVRGKPKVADSRWFYYWLRSPLGEQCISSLARGAVRERMLFNRLAEGEIELPDFSEQQQASQALAQIKPMRTAIGKQMKELELMSQKLIAQSFEN